MNARLVLAPLAIALSLAACQQATPPAGDSTPAPAATAPATPAADTAPAVVAQSGTYALDPAHTMVLATWNHMGYSNPSLNFADAKGELVYNAENPSASSVNVTLPLSGITSFTKEFDTHLRSSDFFDIAKFPDATFKSTSVTANGGNKFTVAGDLTIKGITKPVTLDVTLNGAGEHPMTKQQAIGFDATTTLKRSDFGLEMAAPAVSDEVKLRITTEAQMTGAAAAPAAATTAAAAPAASDAVGPAPVAAAASIEPEEVVGTPTPATPAQTKR